MNDFIVSIGTYTDVVLAVGITTGRKVLGASNVGDAACPVILHAGKHSESCGQMADYRHDISSAAEAKDAAIVEGYYTDDRWEYSVTTGDPAHETRVTEIVRERVRERQAKEREEMRSEAEADRQAHEAAVRPLLSEREVALAVAEEWAPGRVAVWQGYTGLWFAGRWDEPYIPGSGTPTETRRVIIEDMRRFENERHIYVATLA